MHNEKSTELFLDGSNTVVGQGNSLVLINISR